MQSPKPLTEPQTIDLANGIGKATAAALHSLAENLPELVDELSILEDIACTLKAIAIMMKGQALVNSTLLPEQIKEIDDLLEGPDQDAPEGEDDSATVK